MTLSMTIPVDCIINKSQKLSNEIYNNIVHYIRDILYNTRYKTEEQQEDMQYYINSIMMIINFYKLNRIGVNKRYINLYNRLMLKITYLHEQNNVNL